MPQNTTLQIRQLETIQEFSDAVRLQRQVWGFDDVELLPLRLFVVASKIGGQVLGVFQAGQMVAFCLCIPGLKHSGKSYLHSHMLGVLPRFRNTGLGRRLKLEQRAYGLRCGLDLIEWTFDPLELKNAYFNIERLGAIARRYVHNQYGTTSSHLHGGLPTDRLVAEWWIRTPRAQAYTHGDEFERPRVESTIAVPRDISEIRKQEPSRAREIQATIGEQFERHFRAGLAVIGFSKDERAGTYLLAEWRRSRARSRQTCSCSRTGSRCRPVMDAGTDRRAARGRGRRSRRSSTATGSRERRSGRAPCASAAWCSSAGPR
jgi:predicted GNAT superfamily acetyltransferase